MDGMMRTQNLLRSNPAAHRAGRALGAFLPAALLAAGLLAGGAPVQAEEVRIQPTPADALDPAGLDVGEEGIQLTLDQAVEVALRRNLGLVIERYNWIQTREGILQSLGIYDALLSGSAQLADETSPTVELVEGVPVTQEQTEFYTLSLSQVTPLGGLAELSTTAFTQETNSQNVFLNPLFSTSADLTYTQPLLRGLGRLATERQFLVAKASTAQSVELFEQQVSQVIRDVEQAYWDLVEARNQLVVAQEAAQLAQVLHDQNEVRVDVGTLAPLELIQSEAGIAAREEDIIRAEAAIGDAADRLRFLLNLESGPYWDAEIVPATDPETERVPIDLAEAIETALSERPEVASQLYRLEALEIDESFFRNLARPQLDLIVGYGLFGQAGDAPAIRNPDTGEVEQPALEGDLSDVIDDVRSREFDSWSAQLIFSYPLQNRERRAQATIAGLAVDQGLAELERLQRQIVTEVRAAARQVETAAKQIESARVSRRLEERNLDAERKRYENGMSSSFVVLQIQEDLTQARSREVSAVTAYRRALAEFYRSVGVLLEQKGVELDVPEREYHRFGGWSEMFGRRTAE
jgi:outer membrane protein TolC